MSCHDRKQVNSALFLKPLPQIKSNGHMDLVSGKLHVPNNISTKPKPRCAKPAATVFPLVCMRISCITYVIIEEIHDEGGHATIDADEEVDASQHHISCAGHAEDEGGRVHQGGDGPPAVNKETPLSWSEKQHQLSNLFFLRLT